jgi:hypothetical protein
MKTTSVHLQFHSAQRPSQFLAFIHLDALRQALVAQIGRNTM